MKVSWGQCLTFVYRIITCFVTYIHVSNTVCCLITAKKFGVTEFVNPKDHDKPIQEVFSSTMHTYVICMHILFFDCEFL